MKKTIKKNNTIPVSKITLLWSCTECKVQAEQPLGEIVEAGTAICPECGEDMELYDDVLVGE